MQYNETMSLDDVSAKILEKMALAPIFGTTIKFDFGDDGCLMMDGTQSPPVMSQEDGEAETTLSCSVDTMNAILAGTQDPNMAFMMGKLKVAGSMGYAMKLNSILED